MPVSVPMDRLVDLDRPIGEADHAKSRKRKEPHGMSTDNWSLPFSNGDYWRRQNMAREVASRPEIPTALSQELRQPPELHKAVNGMCYAQRHALADADPTYQAHGPAYFTTYKEDVSKHSQSAT